MTKLQMAELARMQAVGMLTVAQLERRLDGTLSPAEEAAMAKGSRGIVRDFLQVARAVRQIIVLERELAGLRPARRNKPAKPEAEAAPADVSHPPKRKRQAGVIPGMLRDNTPDYYDFRPMDQAVGWVRETLNIDAPPDDPFEVPPRAKDPAAPKPPEAAEPEPQAAAPAPAIRPVRKTPHPVGDDFPAGFALSHAFTAIPTDPWRGLPPRGPP